MDESRFLDEFHLAVADALVQSPFHDLFERFHVDRDAFLHRAARYCLGIARINQSINLTAITSPGEMALKHVIDSVSCFLIGDWPTDGRVCDVGTGGGFPGAIITAMRPDLNMTFVDSVQKKLKAVEKVATDIGIDATYVHGRAETVGADTRYRETFDVVVARALANLAVAAELCLPLVTAGGWFIAMKGPQADEELEQAKRAVQLLGGVVDRVLPVTLPNNAGDRTLIAIRKVDQTPSKYPRRPGTPRRDPL